jgi:site-specific recombinase XerD
MIGPVTLHVARERAGEYLGERLAAGEVNQRSHDLYLRHVGVFLRYLTAQGMTDTSGITPRLVDAWVDAPISSASPGSRGRAGAAASLSTRRNRQVSIRGVMRDWATRGWVDEAVVPSRVIDRTPSQAPCPLTPAEAKRLRVAGQQSPADSLLPALVALGLAGVNHTEIARLTLDSYDSQAGSLTVVGRGERRTRVVELDAVARRQIDVHVRALGKVTHLQQRLTDPAWCPLALPTAPRTHRLEVSATAVGQHIYRALEIAGITRTGVTPGSLQDYAANACYARGNRIEDVAALLGFVSLDAAMRLIDRDWQAVHGDAVREQ